MSDGVDVDFVCILAVFSDLASQSTASLDCSVRNSSVSVGFFSSVYGTKI